VEALALLLQALGLLEKALSALIAEQDRSEPLRRAFCRILVLAEVAARRVRTPCAEAQKPARPKLVIFEFAVQQAKEAAVALSQGQEVGGWEEFCHERLTLALLLFDLLLSEADGDDISTLSSFTGPISKFVSGISHLV